MTMGLTLYRLASAGLAPLAPSVLRARTSNGKEPRDRQNERFARLLLARPPGQVIWLHGASLGETKLTRTLGEQLRTHCPDAFLLFTSQSRTSAEQFGSLDIPNAHHQLAPIDTPASASRFIAHWTPDLCIFAEGEIWPNLILAADKSAAKLALVNARMTDRSIAGWQRWPGSARRVFSTFDLILAADVRTADGLSAIIGKDIKPFGSLKTAQTDPVARPRAPGIDLGWDGPVLLGASTHEGEEALLLDALDALPAGSRLILAPRHPERGDAIAETLANQSRAFVRRAHGDAVTADTAVLLADTIGEMTHWYAVADHVYLGGAHVPGIGGHNPIEPLAFGKPVLTGPYATNFADMIAELQSLSVVKTVSTATEIAEACRTQAAVDASALDRYFAQGRTRLETACRALAELILPAETP